MTPRSIPSRSLPGRSAKAMVKLGVATSKLAEA